MLDVVDLHASYGAVNAVHGVSMRARSGQVTLVIGANGAGKTTSLRALSGFHRAKSGSVKLEDVELVGKSAHEVARRGMVLVPEGRKVFAPLTVEENLRMGGYLVSRRESLRTMEEVFAQFPILSDRSHQAGGLLSGGEQQMLAFGRALMARPRVMLLDEPSMGLAPTMVDRVMSSVRSMADRGIAVLMVEQNADAALPVADEVYVITRGETVWNGPAASADRAAMHAVLGESAMDGVDPAGERATANE